MTGLLIRYVPGEGTLRSVGGPPNGIVSVSSHPAHFGFVVDSGWEPPPVAELEVGVANHEVLVAGDELPEWVTPVGLAEAVEAAEGPETLGVLWQVLSGSLVMCARAVAEGGPGYLSGVDGLSGVAREFVEVCS